MSALLAGSTLLLTLYFRLPQALYAAGEAAPPGGAEYVDFANVVSIFWGIVMTLTLVAVRRVHHPLLLSSSIQKGYPTDRAPTLHSAPH